MASEAAEIPEDLKELQHRFEEFRATKPGHVRLPEPLWTAAVALAKRYGVHPTAHALRLEYSALKRKLEGSGQPSAKRKMMAKGKMVTPPSFLKFVAPGAKAVTNCTVEVESVQGGKLRLELKSVATTELADLIRAFAER